MTPAKQNSLPRAERIYRLLLRAYPAAFHEAFGSEMLRTFQDSCSEEHELHGKLRFHRFWLPAVADVLVNALLLRLGISAGLPKTAGNGQGAPLMEPRGKTVWREVLSSLLHDARYALRTFGRAPAFTAIVVCTLGLGIGANAAIFSIVNGVLLRPLPFKEPERLLRVYETYQNSAPVVAAYRSYAEWRDRNHIFESIGAATPYEFNLESGEEPELLSGAKVTASWFDVLGIAPLLGRTFTPEECQPGRDQVVVLSHTLWQRRFGGDVRILGQPIHLHGRTHTVIGVMPPAPFYPMIEWRELWTPLAIENEAESRGLRRRWLGVVARLKPGVTQEQAQAELSAIHRQLAQEFPSTHNNYGVALRPLHEVVVGRTQTALLVLSGVVGFVLLIACANVANLLLARATAREKEMAIPTTRYKEAGQRAAIYRQILERLETLPGVAAAGAISILPLRGAGSSFVFIEGQPLPESGQERLASYRVVTPDYFRALGVPFLAGQTFTAQEAWRTGNGILINQAMARRFWPNQDPIGKRMKHDRRGEWQTVIGVVGDVRQRGLNQDAQPETYRPPAALTGNVRMTYVLHTRSDPASLTSAIRDQAHAVEPNLALASSRTARGQELSSLRGVVTDSGGAVIASAKLTLKSPNTGFTQSSTTDAAGVYQFPRVLPGSYELRVEKAGFRTFVHERAPVLVAMTTTLNVGLVVGAVNDEIKVEAGAVTALNVVDATAGHALSESEVKNLPFLARNPVNLLTLQPGTQRY